MTTLVTGAVVFAALHVGLATTAEVSRYVHDPVYADKERKLTRIEHAVLPGSPVVVFIGTSRTGNGFDAGGAQDVLTAALGRTVGVFNFGVPASGPVTHLLHLKRILANGHRPALILLEILPPLLAELPGGPLEGRFTDGTTLTWNELDWIGRYDFQTENLRTQRRELLVVPWWALRFQIVGRLAPTALPFNLRYDWSRGPDPNGWDPMLVEEVDEERRKKGMERAALEYSVILAELKLGGGAVRALRDLLALCRETRIPVVLVRMPEGASFRAMYPPATISKIECFLHGLTAEYGCRVCNAREWMPDGAFIDGHHLLRSGASVFSDRLARETIAPALHATAGGQP